MSPIDRTYEYQPKWRLICAIACCFGAAAGVLGYLAATNDAGLVINGLIHLPPWAASLLCLVLCTFSLIMVILAALLAVYRLTDTRRVAFSADYLIVPGTLWSPGKTPLRFDEIDTISIQKVGKERLLQVQRQDGKKFKIAAPMLPRKESLDEVCFLLQQRIDEATACDAQSMPPTS